jgi:hypothetical protein
MSENPWTIERREDRNFWTAIIVMVLVAAFAQERFSILFFLGTIWVVLFEISGRLRVQYNYHRRNCELLSEIAAKAQRD